MRLHVTFPTLGLCALLAAPALAAEVREDGTLAAPPATATQSNRAMIHAKSAPIRAEPNNRSHLVHTVFGGHAVEVLGRQGTWTHVRSGRHQGWIQTRTLEPISQNR